MVKLGGGEGGEDMGLVCSDQETGREKKDVTGVDERTEEDIYVAVYNE